MKELRKNLIDVCMDAVNAATANAAPKAEVVVDWLRTWSAVFPRVESTLTAVPVKVYVTDAAGAVEWAVFGTASTDRYGAMRAWYRAPCALSVVVRTDAGTNGRVCAHWREGAK